jgi:hypothetical protein
MIYLSYRGIVVRDSEEGDVEKIKDNIIPAIVEEVRASHGSEPETEILSCMKQSVSTLTTTYNDKIVCMFGDIPDEEGGACIWLITSNEAQKIKKSYVIFTKFFIEFFSSQYKKIYNYVDVRYDTCIRWLERSGAVFRRAEPYGKQGLLFRKWEVVKNVR